MVGRAKNSIFVRARSKRRAERFSSTILQLYCADRLPLTFHSKRAEYFKIRHAVVPGIGVPRAAKNV